MSEAYQDFPIFIDTPLARLDQEHIQNVLLHYYPDLANQVVILATDTEIPRNRLDALKDHIANTYLLECSRGIKTIIKQGYF